MISYKDYREKMSIPEKYNSEFAIFYKEKVQLMIEFSWLRYVMERNGPCRRLDQKDLQLRHHQPHPLHNIPSQQRNKMKLFLLYSIANARLKEKRIETGPTVYLQVRVGNMEDLEIRMNLQRKNSIH